MSARSAHTIQRFTGLFSFIRKVAFDTANSRENFSFVQKGNCDERVGQLAGCRSKKRDTAYAVSPPTSNLIYLFSLSDPAPNSLRCATGRAALAAAAAGIAAARSEE